MKIRLVLLWACAAFAVIALQGAGPVSLLAASTGSSGIQAPSTTSTNTDGSTGGFGDLGTSYNGTYNPPALTLGTTLTEYANTPSWGNQGSGNKHAVAATETLTSTVQTNSLVG